MLKSLALTSQPSSLFPFNRRHMSIRAAVSQASPQFPTAADRKSLYEVLRVKRSASQTEIKTAYRTLAKLYHPDATSRFLDSSIVKSCDSGEDFIEIHNAYETLSDPDARAVYDSVLRFDLPRRLNSGGLSGVRSSDSGRARVRFYQTRRWETDQCW